MPGTPLLPSSVGLEEVPLWTSCDFELAGRSDGLVAQDYDTYQGIAPGVMVPLFGITGISPLGGGAEVLNCTRVAQLTDRFMLRILTPGQVAGVPPTIEISVRAGFGCLAEEVWDGSLVLNTANDVRHVVQVCGLLTHHWQVWARVTDGLKCSVAMRVHLDRAGGQFQLHWGPTVTKIAPVAVTTYP